MLKFMFFLLGFIITTRVAAQSSSFNVNNENISRWQEELNPMTDESQLSSYIHNDPLNFVLTEYIPSGYPLEKEIEINSYYGHRLHPVQHRVKFHRGVDLDAQTGEKVIATAPGTVIESGQKADLGKYIKIRHNFGFETIYGHLSALKVKKNEKVKKRQLIGLVGATGQVTGPHLHYTLKKNGRYIDPFDYIFMDFSE